MRHRLPSFKLNVVDHSLWALSCRLELFILQITQLALVSFSDREKAFGFLVLSHQVILDARSSTMAISSVISWANTPKAPNREPRSLSRGLNTTRKPFSGLNRWSFFSGYLCCLLLKVDPWRSLSLPFVKFRLLLGKLLANCFSLQVGWGPTATRGLMDALAVCPKLAALVWFVALATDRLHVLTVVQGVALLVEWNVEWIVVGRGKTSFAPSPIWIRKWIQSPLLIAQYGLVIVPRLDFRESSGVHWATRWVLAMPKRAITSRGSLHEASWSLDREIYLPKLSWLHYLVVLCHSRRVQEDTLQMIVNVWYHAFLVELDRHFVV